MTTRSSLLQPTKTRELLSSDIWRACGILHGDNNCDSIMEYVELLAVQCAFRLSSFHGIDWAREVIWRIRRFGWKG